MYVRTQHAGYAYNTRRRRRVLLYIVITTSNYYPRGSWLYPNFTLFNTYIVRSSSSTPFRVNYYNPHFKQLKKQLRTREDI